MEEILLFIAVSLLFLNNFVRKAISTETTGLAFAPEFNLLTTFA